MILVLRLVHNVSFAPHARLFITEVLNRLVALHISGPTFDKRVYTKFPFRGNRFNIIFYDAAGIYYLSSLMMDYLKCSHGQLNRLLQAVLSDLSSPKYIAGCKALGNHRQGYNWSAMALPHAVNSIHLENE